MLQYFLMSPEVDVKIKWNPGEVLLQRSKENYPLLHPVLYLSINVTRD